MKTAPTLLAVLLLAAPIQLARAEPPVPVERPAVASAPPAPATAQILPPPPPAASDALRGLAEAIDGDTLRLGGAKIRLFGIRAPERYQQLGPAARDALAELLLGREVACERRGESHDRIVAVCRLAANGRDLAESLLADGLAKISDRALVRSAEAERYREAERLATGDGRGLWASDGPPWWERFQEAIVGAIGFLGVIITLIFTAKFARQQVQDDFNKERKLDEIRADDEIRSLLSVLDDEINSISKDYQELLDHMNNSGIFNFPRPAFAKRVYQHCLARIVLLPPKVGRPIVSAYSFTELHVERLIADGFLTPYKSSDVLLGCSAGTEGGKVTELCNTAIELNETARTAIKAWLDHHPASTNSELKS